MCPEREHILTLAPPHGGIKKGIVTHNNARGCSETQWLLSFPTECLIKHLIPEQFAEGYNHKSLYTRSPSDEFIYDVLSRNLHSGHTKSFIIISDSEIHRTLNTFILKNKTVGNIVREKS